MVIVKKKKVVNKLKTKSDRVFLDYASATPIRLEVREAMKAYEDEHFANPSALYIEAREAKTLMQKARADVGEFLNCAHEQIVFTGGGTEGNNAAILGVFEKARQTILKPHIISVATEHPSVREVLDEVVRRGGDVTLLQPHTDGLISPQEVVDALTPSTVLVSVMLVNNEIGIIQPVREIARILALVKKNLKNKKDQKNQQNSQYPYVHTDACQAPLFQSIDVSTLGVDLLTLDGLKIGGPRGSGILYVSHGTELSPIIFGGGQEGGLRSGTEDIASIIGLATALKFAKKEKVELAERMETLRDYLWKQIQENVGRIFPTINMHVNGSLKHRVANNLSVCFGEKSSGLDAEYLVVALDTYGVACSYSSSCRTLKEDSSSYVVEALDNEHKHDCAHSSLRFTLGRETTREEIDRAVEALIKAIGQVRM